MTTALNDVTVDHLFVGIGAIVAIWALYKSVMHALKKVLGDLPIMVKDWAGEPARPGVERRPGVMERLGHIENQLKESTTLDARVTKLESAMATLQSDISTIKTVLLVTKESKVLDEDNQESVQ